MEVEHFLGVKGSALEQRRQAFHSLPEGHAEPLLLRPHNLGDPLHLRPDLGVNGSQQPGHDWYTR